MASLAGVRKDVRKCANKQNAEHAKRFFKTGAGEYGEGDVFLGLRVPQVRAIAKNYNDLPIDILKSLVASKYHEERMLALIIVVNRYKKADEKESEKLYKFFVANRRHINNWDLVDVTVPQVIGAHLMTRSREPLFKWAVSKDLWERRIAIMATFYFIRENDFSDALRISKILLNDEQDLIHKAVGWMLREVGNRDRNKEEAFLKAHYKNMPRTMLRYAIEKFPETKRQSYLKGRIK